MAYVHIVLAGEMNDTGIHFSPVAAFLSRRNAQRMVQTRKQEDPYTHQYDYVLGVRLDPNVVYRG